MKPGLVRPACWSATGPRKPVFAWSGTAAKSLTGRNPRGDFVDVNLRADENGPPAIAATEAQYAEMWAQDAAAMYAYAGSSASASQLTPFTEPPQTTSSAAAPTQAAAVSQASSVPASNIGAQLSQLITSLPTALQSLANGILQSPTTAAGNLLQGLDLPNLFNFTSLPAGLQTDLTNWNTITSTITSGPGPVVQPGIRLRPKRAGPRRLWRPESHQRWECRCFARGCFGPKSWSQSVS